MPSSAKPVLSVEPHDRVLLAKVLCPDLEHESTQQLQTELASALEAGTKQALVLDLSHVEFMPSMALGLLVKIHKSVIQSGRKCVLIGTRERVLETLRITTLDNVLVLRDTLDDALKLI